MFFEALEMECRCFLLQLALDTACLLADRDI